MVATIPWIIFRHSARRAITTRQPQNANVQAGGAGQIPTAFLSVTTCSVFFLRGHFRNFGKLKMANRKLPAKVHKIRGTHRKHRHGNNDENLLTTSYPEMPDHVDSYPGADVVWKEVKAAMEEADVYSSADTNKLGRYCILEAGFRNDPVGFSETAARLTQLRLLENDLYLSPESRAKVGGKKNQSTNKFQDF